MGLPPNDDRSPYPRSGGIHSQRHVEGRNEGKEGTEGNEGNEGNEVGEVGEVRDAEGGGQRRGSELCSGGSARGHLVSLGLPSAMMKIKFGLLAGPIAALAHETTASTPMKQRMS